MMNYYVVATILGIIIIFLVLIIYANEYFSKYAKKAKLLLENRCTGADSVWEALLINPALTKREIKKNHLVSFTLLLNSKNFDSPIKVYARLNDYYQKNNPTQNFFVSVRTMYEDKIIFVENLLITDCNLIVKYFVLKDPK